uniref:Uncharacterized protein n=1 Tax=Rhizophora mucronata TaxID=61149 RepID=A0A2P2QFA2_RHIMU
MLSCLYYLKQSKENEILSSII